MGHLSVLRAMFFWGIGVLMILFGFIAIIGSAQNPTVDPSMAMILIIGGFGLLVVNKIVFKARRVQREVDANEAIKRLERKVEYLEKKKESGN